MILWNVVVRIDVIFNIYVIKIEFKIVIFIQTCCKSMLRLSSRNKTKSRLDMSLMCVLVTQKNFKN